MEITLIHNDRTITCTIHQIDNEYFLTIHDSKFSVALIVEKWDKNNNILYCFDGTTRYKIECAYHQNMLYGIIKSTNQAYPSTIQLKKDVPFKIAQLKTAPSSTRNFSSIIKTPLSGRVVSLLVKEKDSVREGDPLIVVESMKMENEIRAHRNGIIKTILITMNDVVETDQAVIVFNEPLDEGEADEKNKIENR